MNFLFFVIISLTPYAFSRDIRSVSVQGKCHLKVTPDRGRITMTAENESRNQKEAVKKSTDQINELRKIIKKINPKNLELKSVNYHIYPIREYEKDRMVNKGIKATLGLEVVSSEIEKLSEILTEASDLGIKNIGDLQFFLSIEESEKNYLKCLEVASINAKLKAEQLAKKLQFKVGEVLQVIEGDQSRSRIPPVPQGGMIKSFMTAESSAPQMEAGEEDFSITLDVTFGIK